MTVVGASTPAGPQAPARVAPVVRMLGRFDITVDGEPVDVTVSGQRLVGFLALHDRPVTRLHAAGCLWLDHSEQRAQANLRSTLWRLRRACPELVSVVGGRIALGETVRTDLCDVVRVARALVEHAVEGAEPPLSIVAELSAELLPEWYDDFVEVERERIRQLRLHALEAFARHLARTGRPAQGLEAALAAVAVDPLRESAHRVAIEIHLGEGNLADALRQFRHLTRLLNDNLGIEPSERTEQLLRGRLRVAVGRAHSRTTSPVADQPAPGNR